MSLTVGELQGMLDEMSVATLRDLHKLVEHKIAEAARRQCAAEIMATATAAGLTIEDLRRVPDQAPTIPPAEPVSEGKPRSKRARAQYVNPANPSQTWEGKGRRPAWLAAQLKNGKGLETFRTSSRH